MQENLGLIFFSSGTKKEPKPKLLSPDIFWWGGGLPRDIPGFCRDIPEAPEKFEKKSLGSILVPYFVLSHKGPAERGHVKKYQESSRNVKTYSMGSLWPFRGASQPENEESSKKSLEMGSHGLPDPGCKKVRKELKTS